MIPVVIKGSVYEEDEYACLHRVSEMIQSLPSCSMGVLIDRDSLKATNKSTTNTSSVSRVNLSDWIDSKQHPLKVAIRTQANALSADQVMLLDARHYDSHVIDMVLYEVSQTWFHINPWQPAFVLVVDDHLATRFARTLSDVLYIKTLLNSKHAIQAEERNIRRHIMSHRWLGFGRAARLARSTHIFLQKLKHYAYRKIS